MDDEILEGEVIDPGDPGHTPWITPDVEAFQQYMGEMKQAYLFAADLIAQGAFQPPPAPRPTEPGRRYVMVRRCGEALVAMGSWLLAKCPAPAETLSEEPPQREWGWAEADHFERPARLPLPE